MGDHSINVSQFSAARISVGNGVLLGLIKPKTALKMCKNNAKLLENSSNPEAYENWKAAERFYTEMFKGDIADIRARLDVDHTTNTQKKILTIEDLQAKADESGMIYF